MQHSLRIGRVSNTLAALLIVCCVATLSAATPLEDLGRITNWYLAFINDPYDVLDAEMKKEEPMLVAAAIRQVVAFPADGAADELKLVDRFSQQPTSQVPRSLQRFIKREFDTWKAGTANQKLKVRIGSSSYADLTIPWRDKNTLVIPVAAVGRSVLRAARDDSSIFKNMMWVLSHPRFSTSRPTRRSDDYRLTPTCSGPTVEGLNLNCGGQAFYASRQTDIRSAVLRFEKELAKHLGAVFVAGAIPQ